MSELLAGKRILVTGATGLLGMYTVAKLLRAVPRLGGVVLPVRGGAGAAGEEEVRERWAKICVAEQALFEGCDLSKVLVLPFREIGELPGRVTQKAEEIGYLHGVLNLLGDSSIDQTQENSNKVNCKLPVWGSQMGSPFA